MMDKTQEFRREFLRKLSGSLELLQEDARLIQQGYQFYDVVDFAAISAYVYKESIPPFPRIGLETNDRRFARSQIALQALFSAYPRPLLMIPPYWEELRNDLRALALKIRVSTLDAGSLYKEKFARMVASSEGFRAYVDLRRKNQEKKISPELREQAIEICRKFFPELYAALAFVLFKGKESITALVRNKIITDAAPLLPECDQIVYDMPGTDEWYKKIIRRRGFERAPQSYTDAMACWYIEWANQQLNASRKIVVFVAPSSSVSTTLAGRPLITLDAGRKMPATRDLTYCQLASTLKYDCKLIDESLETVNGLIHLYDSPIPFEWFVDKREKAAEDWKRCENLSLMTTSAEAQLEKQEQSFKTERELMFLDVLDQMYSALKDNSEEYANRLSGDLNALQAEVTQLIQDLPGPRPGTRPALDAGAKNELLQVIRVKDELPKGLRVVLPGLRDELPTQLFFSDSTMISLAKLFQQFKEQGYSDDGMASLRNLILDARSDPGACSDHHLLAGYVLAVEGKYDEALSELDAGWARAGKSETIELSLACAMVHRRLRHGATACELLKHALTLDPDDPRLLLEMAKNLWLKWSSADNPNPEPEDLLTALSHLDEIRAMSGYRSSKNLCAQTENVSTVICTELAILNGENNHRFFDQAQECMKQMEEALAVEKWPGRFFDTRGYLSYARAKYLEIDPIKRRRLLESADADFAKAISLEKPDTEAETGKEPGIRQKHKDLNDQALLELVEA